MPVICTVNLSALTSVSARLSFGSTLDIISRGLTSKLSDFALLTVPFFVLSNGVVGRKKVTQQLVGFTHVLNNHLPNSLTRYGVLTGVLFKTVSNSTITSTTTVNNIVRPRRIGRNCSPTFDATIGITSTPANLLVPPDGALVICSLIDNNASVTTLFLTNCIPKVLLNLTLVMVTNVVTMHHNCPGPRHPALHRTNITV